MNILWLIAMITYALLAWAMFMFAGIANEKVGNDAKPGQDLIMGVLWPITLIFCLVMAVKVTIQLHKAERRAVSEETNSAHRSHDHGEE